MTEDDRAVDEATESLIDLGYVRIASVAGDAVVWTAEIIEGRYIERADCGWLVKIKGRATVVAKDDWAVYR